MEFLSLFTRGPRAAQLGWLPPWPFEIHIVQNPKLNSWARQLY